MTDAPPPVTGLAELVLNVHDLPRMRDFYQGLLGFPLLSESCLEPPREPGGEPITDGPPTICFLIVREEDTPLGRHGHPQLLALIDFRRHVFARPHFDGAEPRRSTLNHLAFEVPPDALDAHRARLVARGLEVVDSAFPAMRARAVFFADPEGNRVELIAHDPG